MCTNITNSISDEEENKLKIDLDIDEDMVYLDQMIEQHYAENLGDEFLDESVALYYTSFKSLIKRKEIKQKVK